MADINDKINKQKHWNKIFNNSPNEKLGWYEDNFDDSMELVHMVPELKKKSVFIAGAGTTGLVNILKEATNKIIINDISNSAIEKLQNQFKNDDEIIWNCHDLCDPLNSKLPQVDLWIDRAVLHFLREENEIDSYFQNLISLLKPKGYVVFAEFSDKGAKRCAGLDVKRYNINTLSNRLGVEFSLIKSFESVYVNPFGDEKPYLYALFQRL